jgi:hypothetical protein
MLIVKFQRPVEKLLNDSRPHCLTKERRSRIARKLLVERHSPSWWAFSDFIRSEAKCGHFSCEVREGGPWLPWGPNRRLKGPASGLFKGEERAGKVVDIEDWVYWPSVSIAEEA